MEIVSQTKQCSRCSRSFVITDADDTFYGQLAVLPPTHCPDCRQQRRLMWRNERNLYWRTCDGTGKKILSVYSPDKPFPVFDVDYWYSDKWDPYQYGRDFDFSRPFFDQFKELMHAVPQLARSVVNVQNCDYVNQCGWAKNCYLIFEADHDENCMYSGHLYDSKSCMDMLYATKSELCYECIDCHSCYNLKFSQDCENCSDSWFLKNCIGCQNCFGCVNLRHKQYCFFNEQLTKEAYEEKVNSFALSTSSTLKHLREHCATAAHPFPHKYLHGVNNEDSSGDYLTNTKNCKECFDVQEGRDCKYVYDARNVRSTYDLSVFGAEKGVDFCYENHEIGEGVRSVLFSDQIWLGAYNIQYSKLCMHGSHDLFGCVGLRKGAYAILNKRYSQGEYESLVTRIIAHMRKTGEYGEFFPSSLTPYAYNETLAHEYYPLTKDQALEAGLAWRDPDSTEYQPQSFVVPDDIRDTADSIVDKILSCTQCGKNYRIVSQELQFYKTQKLPVPNHCFNCRHQYRMSRRNARTLHDRTCSQCSTPIRTTFGPDRPEPVMCEKCYLEVVY